MELTEQQQELRDQLQKVMEEAWSNEAFKAELIAKPEEAIAELTGAKLKLREGVKMVVSDQSEDDTFYFNIPVKPSFDDMELTEDQLELAAGGLDLSWQTISRAIITYAIGVDNTRKLYGEEPIVRD